MNDENKKQPLRKTLGTIPVAMVANEEWWKSYVKASIAFSKAKEASSVAKQKVKDNLKKRAPKLKHIKQMDFIVQGDDISVFEVLKLTTPRRKATELVLDSRNRSRDEQPD